MTLRDFVRRFIDPGANAILVGVSLPSDEVARFLGEAGPHSATERLEAVRRELPPETGGRLAGYEVLGAFAHPDQMRAVDPLRKLAQDDGDVLEPPADGGVAAGQSVHGLTRPYGFNLTVPDATATFARAGCAQVEVRLEAGGGSERAIQLHVGDADHVVPIATLCLLAPAFEHRFIPVAREKVYELDLVRGDLDLDDTDVLAQRASVQLPGVPVAIALHLETRGMHLVEGRRHAGRMEQ